MDGQTHNIARFPPNQRFIQHSTSSSSPFGRQRSCLDLYPTATRICGSSTQSIRRDSSACILRTTTTNWFVDQSFHNAAFPYPPPAHASRPAHTTNPNTRTVPRKPPASPPPISITTSRAPPGAPKSRQQHIRPRADAFDRTRAWHASLSAVKSASLLLPGRYPIKAKRKEGSRDGTSNQSWGYPICGEGISTERHLMDHFIRCVARNGNPEGKHWDDDTIEWKM